MSQITEKAYTSEIKHYTKIALGEREAYFLGLIAQHDKSSYDIFLDQKALTLEDGKEMRYKNVHKRVKRLYELGLIEPIEGEFKRNAIRYRLTSYGLFQRLLLSSPPFDNTPPIVLDKRMKKDNVVLHTILYRYFREETVRAFLQSLSYSMRLAEYLRETCEVIVRQLDEWRLNSIPFHEEMDTAMDELIIPKVKNFIYQIVVLAYGDGFTKERVRPDLFVPVDVSKFPISRPNNYKEEIPVLEIDNELDVEEEEDDEGLDVLRALAKDRSFTEFLKKMKNDFLGGCEIFL